MSLVGTAKQQPNDVQDYDIDFSEWFPAEGVITTAVVSVAPVMPMPPTYSLSPDKKRVKVWIYAGGTSGVTYQVTVRATTNDGRVKEVELKVKIKEV